MLVKVDTENEKVYVDGELVYEKKRIGLADLFSEYRGTPEYTGIVADIQTWYYGFVSKTAWCATAVSYFANKLGKLKAIGGKNENVYNMLKSCKKASSEGYGVFFDRNNIPEKLLKDDILFFLWSDDKNATMTTGSNKHVSVCEYDTTADTVYAIGGNQKDKICTQEYQRKYLYAMYRLSK